VTPADNAPFKQAPERFDVVGMDLAPDPFVLGMIYRLMRQFTPDMVVSLILVRG
jgi:hypothetical protein